MSKNIGGKISPIISKHNRLVTAPPIGHNCVFSFEI